MARFIDLGDSDDQEDATSLTQQHLRRGLHHVSLSTEPPPRSAGDGPVKPHADTEQPRISNTITRAFQCYPYPSQPPQSLCTAG